MPYNPLAIPYQLNTKELPSSQPAAQAYLALSTGGTNPWNNVSSGLWSQSPYYLPNWGDESQPPGTIASQAISPVATASVTRPDAVINARDIEANASLNSELIHETARQTSATNNIAAINAIIGAAPTVLSVSPNTAVHNVATAVTVYGTGFAVSTPTINIGGACTSVVVVDDGELTCLTPASGATAGVKNVVVTTTAGTGTLTGGMTYT